MVALAEVCTYTLNIMSEYPAITFSASAALLIVACGNPLPEQSVRADSIEMTQHKIVQLPSLSEADRLIAERHPVEASAIAAPGAAVDDRGLIGRNREYGRLVSPRFQLGAGAALRIGLQAEPQLAINGFRAIEAATLAVAPDGEVVSIEPPDAPIGVKLSAGDKASGAAFFMADACPALLALRASADAARIADTARQEQAIAAIGRGLHWLSAQADELEKVDRAAPNRLLYDALAYHSCAVLTDNRDARVLSERFVALALSQTRKDGVFVEKGGSDSSYQAVSLRLALDLLLTGYDGADAEKLQAAWQSGTIWLGNRIMADGRIDSSANTRTCKGSESFLGVPKKVSPPGVFGALIYAGELIPSAGLVAAAGRLSKWARANPKVDPCFG
jgi:hypothetical protein